MAAFAARRQVHLRGGKSGSTVLVAALALATLAWLTVFHPGHGEAPSSIQSGRGAAAGSSGAAAAAGGGGPGLREQALAADLPMEVYARGPSKDTKAIERVAALLKEDERRELKELCGRTLYHSLQVRFVSER